MIDKLMIPYDGRTRRVLFQSVVVISSRILLDYILNLSVFILNKRLLGGFLGHFV
jgi:hypothetical protein